MTGSEKSHDFEDFSLEISHYLKTQKWCFIWFFCQNRCNWVWAVWVHKLLLFVSAGFVKGNFKNPVNLLNLPLHILISHYFVQQFPPSLIIIVYFYFTFLSNPLSWFLFSPFAVIPGSFDVVIVCCCWWLFSLLCLLSDCSNNLTNRMTWLTLITNLTLIHPSIHLSNLLLINDHWLVLVDRNELWINADRIDFPVFKKIFIDWLILFDFFWTDWLLFSFSRRQ